MDPLSWAAAEKILTLYGPLALGWLVAWVLWRALQASTKRVETMGEATTKALTETTAALRELRQVIERDHRP